MEQPLWHQSSLTGCFRSASHMMERWYNFSLGFSLDCCCFLNKLPIILYSVLQDYKTYLDFVLALENRKEPAALQYIFKLLDMENQGYLNVFSLNYFFRVWAKHTGLQKDTNGLCKNIHIGYGLILFHDWLCSSGHTGPDEASWSGACFLPRCQGNVFTLLSS